MKVLLSFLFAFLSGMVFSQNQFNPAVKGYQLVWQEEFDQSGKVNSTQWNFEKGFVRNQELQWYQEQNTKVEDGHLVITGRKESISNPHFESGHQGWQINRKQADYTSSSINTGGKFHFQYGVVEVRAKIDTAMGMWPAIWTLGVNNP